MSIKMQLDIQDLQKRVSAIEGTTVGDVQAAGREVVSVARADWDAVLARIEALEGKLLRVIGRKPKAAKSPAQG